MKCLFRRGLRWCVNTIFLMNCCSLLAQVNITGTVVDPDGAAVPIVDVLLKTPHDGTAEGGSTSTDPEGHFRFLRIASGDYQLEVPPKYGFERYLAPVHIQSGMHDLHIQLTPLIVAQDVTVAPETSQVTTDSSSNRDQVSMDTQMLGKVPVFDQNYIAMLTPFLDQTGVATSGVTIIVDGVEMKGTGVSASAIAEAHINNDPYSAETNRPRQGYAAASGVVNVFAQTDLNHYTSLGSIPSGANGRTARLVPKWNRLFVAVPQGGQQNAHILVYEPVNAPESKRVPVETKQFVNAPAAEKIVLETLSVHPLLRKIGLHVTPPGGENMIIVANGNATRIGIRTSESDFAAVKNGGIYGPRIADGEFYNMKMPMFDAQGRRIGILVMEIACTDAVSEEDAAHKAGAIREEVSKKIPSLASLFVTAAGE